MKLSEGQTGDAGEAIQLAALFERFAIDHEPYGWPAIQQHRVSRAAALLRAHAATVAGLRDEVAALKSRFQTSGDESTAAYNAASKRAAAAEGLLREALQSFLCTQRPNDYSRLHWSNKAIAALDAALGEATSPGAERG